MKDMKNKKMSVNGYMADQLTLGEVLRKEKGHIDQVLVNSESIRRDQWDSHKDHPVESIYFEPLCETSCYVRVHLERLE